MTDAEVFTDEEGSWVLHGIRLRLPAHHPVGAQVMTTCSQAVIRKLANKLYTAGITRPRVAGVITNQQVPNRKLHTLDQVRALTPGTVLKLNGRRSLYRTMASRDPNTIQARAFGSHVFDVDESCLPAVIVHVSAMDDTPVPDADQNERDQNTARTARLIKESL